MEYIKKVSKNSLYWKFVLIIICGITYDGYAQEASTSQSNIHFRDGVVTNLKRNELYISNSNAIVESYDLGSGKTIWESTIQGRPLFVKDDILYVQLKQEKPNSELVIAGLNLQDKGNVVFSLVERLPEKVICYFEGTAYGNFILLPFQNDSEYYIQWVFRPIYGGDYMPEERPNIKKGFLRIDQKSIRKINSKDLPKNYKSNSIVPPNNVKIKNVNGQQFFSIDKQHILVSSFTSDPGVEKNYLWKIYDRSSKKQVGQLRQNTAYSPFLIQKSNLIYEQGAYRKLNQEQTIEFPLSLIWLDLNQNKNVAEIQIFDTKYRGPYEP